jgi:hypothetical protein
MRFLAAAGVFCLINIAAFLQQNNLASDSIWSEETRSVISEFSKPSCCPDIVFLGSSLIKAPLWCTDNAIVQNVAQYSVHHRAEYFERQVKSHGMGCTAYNMAINGAYMSDMLVLLDKLVTPSKKPSLIICAISPREFFSNWFLPARATPVFKQLYDPSDYFQTGHLYASDDIDWVDGAFSQLIPLRHHGALYRQEVSDFSRRLLSLPPATKDSHFVCDIQTALGAGSAQNTLADYYNSTSMNRKIKLYCNQKECLREFLSLAAKRRQKVLLVSLPLRQDAQLKIYQPLDCDYRKFLQELQNTGQANVLDMESDPVLCRAENFMDSWHLNERGGKILITRLIRWLQNQPKLLDPIASTAI